MKKFISKTNKYLLENYPTIWNTKIVWMLSCSLLIHLAFFILGFLTISSPKMLHESRAKDIFFDSGTVFFSVILSILLIVVWLVYLFKNNAFKSLYPLKRSNLFGQFLAYLIIIFFASTFYISYSYGVKTLISSKYETSRINAEIDKTNIAATFFSENLDDYTINNRKYPAPFDSLYCETNTKNVDSVYLKFLNFNYDYFTLYTKEGGTYEGHNSLTYQGYVFKKVKDTTATYYYKDKLVDMSQYVTSAYPSYFNYSKTFYNKDEEPLNYYIDYDSSLSENVFSNDMFAKGKTQQNKVVYELLKRNNPEEIKKVLIDFLDICDAYEIKHNLSVDEWFTLIYYPEDFKLNHLIRSETRRNYKYAYIEDQTDNVKSPEQQFNKEHLTNYFLDHDALHTLFTNVKQINDDTPLTDSIHIFLWLAFFLSCIIFIFRVTGIKSLIFSVITVIILIMLVALVTIVTDYLIGFNSKNTGYFSGYLTLIIASVILSIPVFFKENLKKGIVAVCLNISIVGFILYVFLILVIVSMHQDDLCSYYTYGSKVKECFNLLGSIGILWSFILFIVALIFMYFYTQVIKNWKALPES